MTFLTIPRPLRDKLGEDATDAFIEVMRNIDLEGKRDLATKSDIQDVKAEIHLVKAEIQLVKTDLDGKIDKLRTELYGKFDNLKTELSGQSKLYFFILLFVIVLSNPKAIELLSKLTGIVK